MTAEELGDEVLRLTGVVSDEDTPTTTQRARALTLLNSMMDALNVEGLLQPYSDIISHTLTIDDPDYTVGPSGTIVAARPTELKRAWIRDTDNLDLEIEVIEYEDYQAIADKSSSSNRPSKIAYKKTATNGTIYLWPKPDKAYSLRMLAGIPFGTFVAATSVDNIPGYNELFKYNLALRVADYYGKEPSEFTAIRANDTIKDVRRQVHGQHYTAPVNPGVIGRSHGGYDIRRGY